jgi:hypothetical protein
VDEGELEFEFVWFRSDVAGARCDSEGTRAEESSGTGTVAAARRPIITLALHEVVGRQLAGDTPLMLNTFKLALKCVTRRARRRACTADALRVAPTGPVARRPQPLAGRLAPRQFEDLSLFHHRWGQLLPRVDPLPYRSSHRSLAGDSALADWALPV